MALATHRFIEQNGLTDELNFAGSVCGDGPYDPIATLMYYVKQYNDHYVMSMPVVLPLILKGMCDSNPYMKNHQVSDYLSSDFLATGILGWLTALASNNLTKGWVPNHAVFLYHSYDDSVVPEVNRESAGNSFGQWAIKLHASGAGQFDHENYGNTVPDGRCRV